MQFFHLTLYVESGIYMYVFFLPQKYLHNIDVLAYCFKSLGAESSQVEKQSKGSGLRLRVLFAFSVYLVHSDRALNPL